MFKELVQDEYLLFSFLFDFDSKFPFILFLELHEKFEKSCLQLVRWGIPTGDGWITRRKMKSYNI